MTVTIDLITLIIFLIVAFLAGTAAAVVAERRERRNVLWNTILGGVGAFIGQLLFSVIKINWPEFLERGIRLVDLVVAFVGALIIIMVVRIIQR